MRGYLQKLEPRSSSVILWTTQTKRCARSSHIVMPVSKISKDDFSHGSTDQQKNGRLIPPSAHTLIPNGVHFQRLFFQNTLFT